MAAARETRAGGRPRKQDRCPCGAMTMRRAQARGKSATEHKKGCIFYRWRSDDGANSRARPESGRKLLDDVLEVSGGRGEAVTKVAERHLAALLEHPQRTVERSGF